MLHRLLRAVPAALIAVAVLIPATAMADEGGRSFTTQLTGAAEVPGPGDPDATGTATVTLNQGRDAVCYSVSWEDVDGAVTASHIHVGSSAVAGPVVVPLFVGAAFAGTGQTSGCTTGVDRALLKAIRHQPSAYYVNVHSTVYPAGASRGQLSK